MYEYKDADEGERKHIQFDKQIEKSIEKSIQKQKINKNVLI